MKRKITRRGFIKKHSQIMLSVSLASYFSIPMNVIPLYANDAIKIDNIHKKNDLTILNDRPINAETPPHLLNDSVTPTNRHFVRNNGIMPNLTSNEVNNWTLKIEGNVHKEKLYTIKDLKENFEVISKVLQLECGGNGRAFFSPPTPGNQWTYGAISCSEWTGVRLLDVLKASGIKDTSIYTGHYGADIHLSGNENKDAISRGVPIKKALDVNNIIAFSMNGKNIPKIHGSPLRLICPGWPGSTSQKWLTKIKVLDHVHDGTKMTGKSYKIPKYSTKPGNKVSDSDFKIIESMPVKSLITFPKTGLTHYSLKLNVNGHAWAGDKNIKKLEISIDYGVTWIEANLFNPINKYAWQDWNIEIIFPSKGYYEIWSKATDEDNISQPYDINWNPKGYLNNTIHRIHTVINV
ncbi:MAG: sulfite oxidase [Alphaproteobacteria bacterium]|nr:sulfite oxidase [Alphaproteobacteria bacterium]